MVGESGIGNVFSHRAPGKPVDEVGNGRKALGLWGQ